MVLKSCSAVFEPNGLNRLLVYLQVLFNGTDTTNEAEMQRAKEEAERVAMEKSNFLAAISHEIRTPLHCIVGYMQLLQVCHVMCRNVCK